jgi:hypothetical protein
VPKIAIMRDLSINGGLILGRLIRKAASFVLFAFLVFVYYTSVSGRTSYVVQFVFVHY